MYANLAALKAANIAAGGYFFQPVEGDLRMRLLRGRWVQISKADRGPDNSEIMYLADDKADIRYVGALAEDETAETFIDRYEAEERDALRG